VRRAWGVSAVKALACLDVQLEAQLAYLQMLPGWPAVALPWRLPGKAMIKWC